MQVCEMESWEPMGAPQKMSCGVQGGAGERAGEFLNDDKQQQSWESFQVSVRHQSDNSSLFVC